MGDGRKELDVREDGGKMMERKHTDDCVQRSQVTFH